MRFGICVALAWLLFAGTPCGHAQNGGGNQGGGNQGGNNGGQFPGGILINPEGLIDRAVIAPGSGAALKRQLKQAAERNLSTDLNRPSERRQISLRRLEAEIRRGLDAGEVLSSDVLFMAGLTRIDYVFVTEDGQDIVIAGPAEGFATINGGRFVGVESGRPVLCLDDLLIAFRSAAEQGAVGCSIDPDPTRLRDAQQWLKQNSAPSTVDVAKARLARMVSLQGAWKVTTFGVPEDSRMAVAMVEADYLMKRIAIGVDNPGVKGLKTSLALAGAGDNMMRRWWFAPHYEAIERNQEGTAFHLSGPRLRLFGQEELMDANGVLSDADVPKASSEKFAKLFNERIDEIVRRVPAFADLQNMFDILVTAAVILDSRKNETLRWQPELLLDANQFATASYTVPQETTPMLNIKSTGAGLVIGVFSGGVSFKPRGILREISEAKDGSLADRLKTVSAKQIPDMRWWWD